MIVNLRKFANNAIAVVNPNIPATLNLNTGYETSDTGKRVSKFENLS